MCVCVCVCVCVRVRVLPEALCAVGPDRSRVQAMREQLAQREIASNAEVTAVCWFAEVAAIFPFREAAAIFLFESCVRASGSLRAAAWV